MRSWFRNSGEEVAQKALDELTRTLENQQRENAKLKNQLEDLKEADQKNRMLLEEFQKNSEESDLKIQKLKETLSDLETQLVEVDTRIGDLNEEKFRLMVERDSQAEPANDLGLNTMQDLLDLVESENEILGFKDSKDVLWVIRKRNDILIKEEDDEVHLATPDPNYIVNNIQTYFFFTNLMKAKYPAAESTRIGTVIFRVVIRKLDFFSVGTESDSSFDSSGAPFSEIFFSFGSDPIKG